MEKLALFLDKFKLLKTLDFDLKAVLTSSIKKHTGLEILPEDISVTRHGVYLQISSSFKSVIFINREKIEADVLQQTNYLQPPNVI
ncbi:MAG: hypothetical protein AAB364_02975 [Patescibacteria group bacterium]